MSVIVAATAAGVRDVKSGNVLRIVLHVPSVTNIHAPHVNDVLATAQNVGHVNAIASVRFSVKRV